MDYNALYEKLLVLEKLQSPRAMPLPSLLTAATRDLQAMEDAMKPEIEAAIKADAEAKAKADADAAQAKTDSEAAKAKADADAAAAAAPKP
jgi:hypothetical protein